MVLARISMEKKIVFRFKEERIISDWERKHLEAPPTGKTIGGTTPIIIQSRNSTLSHKNSRRR